MATKTIVTLYCDPCGTDKDVETHTIAVDGRAPVLVDTCTKCWSRASERMFEVLATGRSAKRAEKRAEKVRAEKLRAVS